MKENSWPPSIYSELSPSKQPKCRSDVEAQCRRLSASSFEQPSNTCRTESITPHLGHTWDEPHTCVWAVSSLWRGLPPQCRAAPRVYRVPRERLAFHSCELSTVALWQLRPGPPLRKFHWMATSSGWLNRRQTLNWRYPYTTPSLPLPGL